MACPENTIAAFQRALDEGADLIETDLQITADNEIICLHDATLDRTTNGKGNVSDFTLRDVKTLSAANLKTGFESEKIPTLQELLEIIPPDRAVALEFKSPRLREPEICEKLSRIIDTYHQRNRTVFLSFSTGHLRSAHQAAPDVLIGLISYIRLKPASFAQLAGPVWPLLLLNPLYVRMAHRQNQLVCPLDPRPDSRLWFYLALGCDAILTDAPGPTIAKCRALLKKTG